MRPGRRFGPATLALAILTGAALAQAPLKPELAEQVGQAFEGWWERSSEVADAVHALYFGASSPERTAQRQAFEDLQERLLTDARRSQAATPEAFAERCRRFIERLESGVQPGVPRPAGLSVRMIR